MKKLYQFYWDCGRAGSVEGLFIAEEDFVNKHIGNSVYFGEILGKHSEVEGTMDEDDLKIIDIPNNVVELLEEKLGKTISGYNPLESMMYECTKCGESWIHAEEMNLETIVCLDCESE